MRHRDLNSKPVFSTDAGELCKTCGEPIQSCSCEKTAKTLPAGDQVRIGFESKGRGGKAVSLVTGLALQDDELKELAKALKKTCGTGGSVKDGVIEIQGDHRDKIAETLLKRGIQAKRSGGR